MFEGPDSANITRDIRQICFPELTGIYYCFDLEDPKNGTFTQKTLQFDEMEACRQQLHAMKECVDKTITDDRLKEKRN